MNRDDVRYGQRIRVNLPGVGDHGQRRDGHADLGQFLLHPSRLGMSDPHRVVVLYARDLDAAPR